jgi:hypothetical protein
VTRITPIERGPGTTPACARCGNSENVIRLWHNGGKVWACKLHFRLTTSEAEEQTLKDRVLRRPVKAKTVAITDVLPNRKARRAHGKAVRKRA